MKLHKLALALGVVFSGGMLITACSDGSSGTTVIVAPDQPPSVAAAVQALVLDAKTGSTISSAVKLTLWGTDVAAGKLVDGAGVAYKEGDTIPVDEGVADLYVKAGTTVDATHKLSFRLVANVSGYVTNSQDFLLDKTSEDGTIQVKLSLVSESSPPPSVQVASQNVTVTGGKTASAVSTVTPASTAEVTVLDSSGNQVTQTVAIKPVTVTVPAGATMKDASGATLPAGTAVVKVAYNNNATTDSLNTFPGGMTLSTTPLGGTLTAAEIAANGPATFVSGGLTSIEVVVKDANGNDVKAKTFDKPISVTIPITAGTINPDTDTAVVAGDIIPIWSYDTTTGQWSAMKLNDSALASQVTPAPNANGVIQGTVSQAADGTLSVTFMTDHLSYFNLDWWFWSNTLVGWNQTKKTCDPTIKIIGAQGNSLSMQAILATNGWAHEWSLDADLKAPAFATDTISSAPAAKMFIFASLDEVKPGVTNKMVSTINNGGLVPGAVVVNNMCDSSKWPITIDVSKMVAAKQVPKTSYANVNVTTRDVCTNDATKVTLISGNSVSAKQDGDVKATVTTNSSGVAVLSNLVVGQKYKIVSKDRATNIKKSVEYTVQSGSNAVSLDYPVTTCKKLTGGSK